jgi:hypothetical protein
MELVAGLRLLQIFWTLLPLCCAVTYARATGPWPSIWQCNWARRICRHSPRTGRSCGSHLVCCEGDKQQYSYLVHKLVRIGYIFGSEWMCTFKKREPYCYKLLSSIGFLCLLHNPFHSVVFIESIFMVACLLVDRLCGPVDSVCCRMRFCSGYSEEFCPLGCNTIYFIWIQAMFWSNV